MITPKIKTYIGNNEGCSLDAYYDTKKFPTIGWGHKIRSNENFPDGITQEQADRLFIIDLDIAANDALLLVPTIETLCEARQCVIYDMTYNMGMSTFSEFKLFLAAIAIGDWQKAVAEMENSDWYIEVKDRAIHNCALMANGEF